MATASDGGGQAFLEFLSDITRTQAEDLLEAAGSTEALADANLLTRLTKRRSPIKQPKAAATPSVRKPARSQQSPKASQSWNSVQDDVLKKAVAANGGKNWKQIAASVPGKSPTQCLHRWQRVLNPNVVKGPWKPEEDAKLRELVGKIGSKHWSRIAQDMSGRNGKQCRERYINHLKPDILKEPWSREEEEVLLRAYADIGSKWAEMEKILPGRTENAIKNHWHSTLRKSRTMEDLRQNEQNRAARRKRSAKPATTARKSEAKAAAKPTHTKLKIDTSNIAPAAPPPGGSAALPGTMGHAEEQRVSPVFSPARANSPDVVTETCPAEPAGAAAVGVSAIAVSAAPVTTASPVNTSASQQLGGPPGALPSAYAAGDLLVVRPDASGGAAYRLCRVQSASSVKNMAGGDLHVTWYEADTVEGAESGESGGGDDSQSLNKKRARSSATTPVVHPGAGWSATAAAATITEAQVLAKLGSRQAGGAPETKLTLSEADCVALRDVTGSHGDEQGVKRAKV